MIKEINSIKNFAIFRNYQNSETLENFKQYNLFYGWNGSGKSTLSRLFRSIENKKLPEEFSDATYSFTTEGGMIIDQSKVTDYKSNIYVFNNDFIKENIDWSTIAKSILLVSKEKIGQRKELNDKKERLSEKSKEYQDAKISLEQDEKKIPTFLSSVAKKIKSNFQIIDTSDAYYLNYNRTRISELIQRYNDDLKNESKLLNEEVFNNAVKAAKPDFKELINHSVPHIDKVNYLKKKKKVGDLLKETIVAKTIERLENNATLSSWIEDGLSIHRSNDLDKCEFCSGTITLNRLNELEAHFNKNFKEVRDKLDTFANDIETMKIDINLLINKNELYEEFQKEFVESKNIYLKLCKKYNDLLTEWKEKLKEKSDNPFHVVDSVLSLEDAELEEINKAATTINNLIQSHNDKTKTFNETVSFERKKLELHYATQELKEFDYFTKAQDIKNEKKRVKNIGIDHQALLDEVGELNAQLSTISLGAEEFNMQLRNFIGHSELSLIPQEDEGGYQIKREINGEKCRAHNLSEGEKTAIAFVYFIIKLKENDNKIEDLTIVIDDPISSFDSNNLYNAYSYLINECNSAKQLFVLTHNYGFYKLIRDWMKNKKTKNKPRKPKYSFYCIDSHLGLPRESRIINAPDSMVDFETEYHYLFFKLCQYKQKSTLNLEEAHLVANMARKVTESFLNFKHPGRLRDLKSLMSLGFGDNNRMKIDRIYRFVNKHSHYQYFDHGESTSDNLLGESQNIIKDLFSLIEKTDEIHYKEMIGSVGE